MNFGVRKVWIAWNSDQHSPTTAFKVERSFSCSHAARRPAWIGNSGPWNTPKRKRTAIAPWRPPSRAPSGTSRFMHAAPVRHTSHVFLCPYCCATIEPGI
jgi:hypothetical protein